MSNTSKFTSRTPVVVALGVFGSLIATAVACDGSTEARSVSERDAGAPGVGGTGAGAVGGGAGSGGSVGGCSGAVSAIPVDKMDLLFMIDNSRSMADKQEILSGALPVLLERLVNPLCVDPDTGALSPPVGGQCPDPLKREFKAIDDIHIGIVTSSLGGHGADTCSQAIRDFDPSENDRGQLLPSVRQGIPQYGNSGFLLWDPSRKHNPPGEANLQTLVENFGTQIARTGEIGCGFEASLEAWYRFLIDPNPPQDVIKVNGEAMVSRPNQTILQQRAAFLRPDSLVAVIMLTDENDCSTFDGGTAWLAGQGNTDDGGPFTLPRATSACQRTPNDPCCRSCTSIEASPPPGCQATDADPACNPRFHSVQSDELNLRCWDQKRRFGVDFLYPVGRYIEGLTNPTVHDFQNAVVPNPLYMDLSGQNQPARPPSLVFLAGIIGVPWQDIATDDTLGSPNDLRYLTAAEITRQGRWDMILGDPGGGVPPTDSLMFESPFDRTTLQALNQSHPLGLGNLVPASGPLRGNPINGNEYIPPSMNDLQYACIFPLSQTRPCAGQGGCDCSNFDSGTGKPLCNGTDQTYAKAYPGLRHLQVLKGIGEQVPGLNNAIVASICPKITDPANPAYGYNPAMGSIIERLKEQLECR